MDPKTCENLVYDKGASWISGAKTEFLFYFIFSKIGFLINGSHLAKDKIRSIPQSIYNSKLQVDQEP